jgi:hypothetical protein
MSRTIVLAALLIILGGAQAVAWLAQAPASGGATSCNAIITGSGANGNAILTGSATALANLTCQ